ncbi:hypothetical protein EYR41_008747 [Orbilia oligospora]|uniref:Uncharacterized protein n=1 Tax=Orbilia oligospora TaxID=2813651 RepID=A0A7C8PS54_ORBOL|nr:hypothetical protein TWF751_002307 [Orbilia oligospora]TGJ67173.1 hypothetical protein EYR41_008747 [Orbilia oligospora]
MDSSPLAALTLEEQVKLQNFWSLLLETFAKPLSTTGSKIIDHLEVDVANQYELDQLNTALSDHAVEHLHTAFWQFVKHENPDAVVLRFLRARSWDVNRALMKIISTLCWRLKFGVEDLLRGGELAATTDSDQGLIHQFRIGKAYIHGFDNENRPVCIISPRLHQLGDQSPESIEKLTVYIMETTRLLCQEPNDTSCIVFDMTGFGFYNMDYTAVRFIIDCLQSHYPESLGVCLIHNAPWIFQGIWSVIKAWLHPVVASKIQFTYTANDLSKFISPQHVPKFLGGKEDWIYEYLEPSSDENSTITDPITANILEKENAEKVRKDIVKEYEQATRRWAKEDIMGEVTEAKDERSPLVVKLKQNYWALDKFLRARTYSDRVGVLSACGKVNTGSEKC